MRSGGGNKVGGEELEGGWRWGRGFWVVWWWAGCGGRMQEGLGNERCFLGCWGGKWGVRGIEDTTVSFVYS